VGLRAHVLIGLSASKAFLGGFIPPKNAVHNSTIWRFEMNRDIRTELQTVATAFKGDRQNCLKQSIASIAAIEPTFNFHNSIV
jgi:hypothetical protein